MSARKIPSAENDVRAEIVEASSGLSIVGNRLWLSGVEFREILKTEREFPVRVGSVGSRGRRAGHRVTIDGSCIGGRALDTLVFGYYLEGNSIYAARTRNGFTPKLRDELMKRFKTLETKECPFANLPEKKAGRWGAGLTAAKMADCKWLKPVHVGSLNSWNRPEKITCDIRSS